MIFDDTVTDCQSKPRSFCFGGVKRFENLFDIIYGNAAAVVGDLDSNRFRFRIHSAFDGDTTIFFNSVQRIEQKVDKNLFDLVFV